MNTLQDLVKELEAKPSSELLTINYKPDKDVLYLSNSENCIMIRCLPSPSVAFFVKTTHLEKYLSAFKNSDSVIARYFHKRLSSYLGDSCHELFCKAEMTDLFEAKKFIEDSISCYN